MINNRNKSNDKKKTSYSKGSASKPQRTTNDRPFASKQSKGEFSNTKSEFQGNRSERPVKSGYKPFAKTTNDKWAKSSYKPELGEKSNDNRAKPAYKPEFARNTNEKWAKPAYKPAFNKNFDEKPVRAFEDEESNLNVVEGRNPVLELLRSDHDVDKLFIVKDAVGSIRQIVALAREKKIPISYCDRHKLDSISQTHSHQGVIAYRSAHNYSEIEDVFALAKSRGEKPLIVICDKITDPHNMGAIIRSAEVVGAHGVIIPKRESAGLNAVCAKTSAGAIEYIPIVRATNLTSVIAELKSKGVWIAGAEADAQSGIFNTDFDIPLAVVIGSEGEGISRLVRENCDIMVNIPTKGKVNSLNASAAAAVILFEVLRSRMAKEI